MNGFGRIHGGDFGAKGFPVSGNAEYGSGCGQGFSQLFPFLRKNIGFNGIHWAAVTYE